MNYKDIKPFQYMDGCPDWYRCDKCNRKAQLYREYQTFLNNTEFICKPCAITRGDRLLADGRPEWRVVCVIAEDGSVPGLTSVNEQQLSWWKMLPV